MQEAVERYAEDVFRAEGVTLAIRIGLNSGEVVVRSLGSDLRMDYSAIGQTTHLAARMEQMARPGTILLTPDTLALAEGFVQVTSRGPVPVKGLTAPIEVFELDGASPVRSRLQATASRGLTPFVGRDAEIELLRQALTQAGDGHGQVVAVVGEPGVGKSRLVWEFTHSHRSQGWLVLETASVPYGRATPYFPVVELLRGYFAGGPRDDARTMREKIVGKLLSLDRALEPTLPVFLSLLDVPVDDPEWAGLDPQRRRRRRLDAITRLLLREAQVAAAARGGRGPALDRLRDTGMAQPPRRQPARHAPAAPGELSAGVHARLGRQDVLPPAADRRVADGERRRAAGIAAGNWPRPRRPAPITITRAPISRSTKTPPTFGLSRALRQARSWRPQKSAACTTATSAGPRSPGSSLKRLATTTAPRARAAADMSAPIRPLPYGYMAGR